MPVFSRGLAFGLFALDSLTATLDLESRRHTAGSADLLATIDGVYADELEVRPPGAPTTRTEQRLARRLTPGAHARDIAPEPPR